MIKGRDFSQSWNHYTPYCSSIVESLFWLTVSQNNIGAIKIRNNCSYQSFFYQYRFSNLAISVVVALNISASLPYCFFKDITLPTIAIIGCRSFSLLKALAKSKGKLIAIQKRSKELKFKINQIRKRAIHLRGAIEKNFIAPKLYRILGAPIIS